MIRYFMFTKGRLLDENKDLGFLKVALYDEDVQIWVDAEQRHALLRLAAQHPDGNYHAPERRK